MKNLKIKASYNVIDSKQYKLFDFCPEFSEFRQFEDNSRFGCDFISKNLIRLHINGEIYFKNDVAVCPVCGSTHNVKNGKYTRILIFLRIGEKECIIQKYKCLKCGKTFSTDMSSIVYSNYNVTIPVIESIRNLYSIFGGSLHKIKYSLKKEHNVDISHQTIENILISSDFKFNNDNWSFSGYYQFDSLWTKIKGQWKYILALFDVKQNTLVSVKIVDSEETKVIYNFLRESLRNQKCISIVTDLKREYQKAISKLNIKHQFCKFHTKQKINKDIRNYFKANKLEITEKEEINNVKELIFQILDSNNIEFAYNLREELLQLKKPKNNLIQSIVWKFIIPFFKNFINHLENKHTPTTNNKIENTFQKVFPKHIKKTMRTEKGVLKRFMLKTKFWEINNKKNKNHTSF